jgi:hypothetical protein
MATNAIASPASDRAQAQAEKRAIQLLHFLQ